MGNRIFEAEIIIELQPIIGGCQAIHHYMVGI